MKLRFVVIIMFMGLLAGCMPTLNVYKRPPKLGWFYNRVVLDYAIRNPELLTYGRILEQYGIDFHNRQLTDVSDEFTRNQALRFKRDLDILRSFDREKLTTKEQISYDVLEWYLKNKAESEAFILHHYTVNQLEGVQNDLPNFMISIHPLESKRDAKNYIRRLSKFPKKFNQLIRGLKNREKAGIHPPKFVAESVLRDMHTFVGKPPQENILYTDFSMRIGGIERLAEADKEALKQEVLNELEQSVYPAYHTLIEYYTSILPKATEEHGVWKLPDGEAYYAYKLRSHATTDLTPQQVYDMGLKEVARLQKEIRQILNDLGLEQTVSIADHLRSLAVDPKLLYPDNEEGRLECIADYTEMIEEAEAVMDQYFEKMPKAEVVVKRVPVFKEKTASGARYEPPSYDGERPGIFYVNLRDMAAIPKMGMRTLAYHEAVPGHHFQVSLQLEMTDVPMFRKILPFTAFVEGWALYAERLAWEVGLLEDPYDNLGRLNSELVRAARLVVDAGIHYKKWSREEAIDYMVTNTGMLKKNIVTEVERYIVDPGQASAYKIGELKILELREKAKQELGQHFDLKRFHTAVLENGAIPINILGQVVDRFIASEKEKIKTNMTHSGKQAAE